MDDKQFLTQLKETIKQEKDAVIKVNSLKIKRKALQDELAKLNAEIENIETGFGIYNSPSKNLIDKYITSVIEAVKADIDKELNLEVNNEKIK